MSKYVRNWQQVTGSSDVSYCEWCSETTANYFTTMTPIPAPCKAFVHKRWFFCCDACVDAFKDVVATL